MKIRTFRPMIRKAQLRKQFAFKTQLTEIKAKKYVI